MRASAFALGFAFTVGVLRGQSADIKVDVDLVNITCSVSTHDNAPVASLKREDFTVLEDGVARDLKYFGRETDVPLTLGLLIDVSGSQASLAKQHVADMHRFLASVMAPGDKAFIVLFGQHIWLLRDLTESTASLEEALDAFATRHDRGELFEPGTRRFAGTRLWDAVYQASRERMRGAKGRKALIVFTDGFDERSAMSLTSAIEAAQGADTLVYTIRSISKFFLAMSLTSPAGAARLAADHGLRRLSGETGGIAFGLKKPSLEEIYSRIETDLRTLYVLGFTPAARETTARFRKVDIRVKEPGLMIRKSAGYLAPAR